VGERFRVGLGSDLVSPDGSSLLADAVAELLEPVDGLACERLGEPRTELEPEHVRDLDAAITLWQPVSARTLAGAPRLATVARWGVGYDMIDVEACTEADVLLSITRDAVRRPVAEAILTFVLVLAKRVLPNDRLVREGRWEEKGAELGLGLRGRVVGTIGLGNIGAELVELLRPLGLGRMLAADPFVGAAEAARIGVELTSLESLLAEADFVCVNCPLAPETRHLVGAPELRLMKPTAYLINTARGPIVDERALVEALESGAIAGAALDVFEEEPLPAGSPLLGLENVVLAPHAIAWTDELFALNGRGACENALAVLRGGVPRHVVNPEVVERPGFRAKLASLRERWEGRTMSEEAAWPAGTRS
jgi:phosphoglycerate dehydrogenase-like enzyme